MEGALVGSGEEKVLKARKKLKGLSGERITGRRWEPVARVQAVRISERTGRREQVC